MFGDAILAGLLVAAISLVGVLFFGRHRSVGGAERYVIPLAVGTFLSLVLVELIPETLELSPEYGGLSVGVGFILFYLLANQLHKRFHAHEAEDCDRRGAAVLLLIGDAIHNAADGIVLGGAFLIDPTVGFATAVGLALHEVPQEIIEFGVLLRAGYTRTRAALYNLLSALSILLGIGVVFLLAEWSAAYMWILSGVAAGNLLFLATSDLLPRIHGSYAEYGGFRRATAMIILGFVLMTGFLSWTHELMGEDHQSPADAAEEMVLVN